jgi:hypothetical protein
VSTIAPTAATEIGIKQIATGTNASDAACLHLDPCLYGLPVGLELVVKIRCAGTATDNVVWAGLVEGVASVPTGAANNSMVGFRTTNGGNWLMVVRDGATESTVDTGLAGDTTWRILGAKRTATGVQARYYDQSDLRFSEPFDVGSEVTTNITVDVLRPLALGVQATSGASRSAQSDFWGVGGRLAR